MRWQDFPPVSDEDQVPLDMTAIRASEGVVLEAKESGGVVSLYLHQRHISVAPYTKHRTHSLTSINFGDVSPEARTITTSFIKNI